MDVSEAFVQFETGLAELMRPQFRDEFRRRFQPHRPLLASILEELPARAKVHRLFHPSEQTVYLAGEFAAFLIGRLDDFDGIDVMVQERCGPNTLCNRARKIRETRQRDGITVRLAFENLPRVLGFHCALALTLRPASDHTNVALILIDECECWWRNAGWVRDFDELRRTTNDVSSLLHPENLCQRLRVTYPPPPGSRVQSFMWAVWNLAKKKVAFVNWNSSRCPVAPMRGAIRGQWRRVLEHRRRRYTFMNFLKPYCDYCRARQRLAVARLKWWRFEACESLSGCWFRSALERYSAEPRMQRIRQRRAVEACLRDVRASSDSALLAKRALLLWNMRTALAAYRRREAFRVNEGRKNGCVFRQRRSTPQHGHSRADTVVLRRSSSATRVQQESRGVPR